MELTDLPDELIEIIHKRMRLKDKTEFKSVNKRFHDLLIKKIYYAHFKSNPRADDSQMTFYDWDDNEDEREYRAVDLRDIRAFDPNNLYTYIFDVYKLTHFRVLKLNCVVRILDVYGITTRLVDILIKFKPWIRLTKGATWARSRDLIIIIDPHNLKIGIESEVIHSSLIDVIIKTGLEAIPKKKAYYQECNSSFKYDDILFGNTSVYWGTGNKILM